MRPGYYDSEHQWIKALVNYRCKVGGLKEVKRGPNEVGVMVLRDRYWC